MSQRLENTSVCCPIAYGSFAHLIAAGSDRKSYALLDKKGPDDLATHEWTLFVRGPNGEDLSAFVERVVFNLHPSFAIPVREVVVPPYEVTETGWGEFEAGIRIFFRDAAEDPIDITHLIKLYHPVVSGSSSHLSKKPVMSEHYDEVVFTNPTERFAECLSRYVTPAFPAPHRLKEFFTVFNDSEDVSKLTSIHAFILGELEASKSEFMRLEAELAYLNGIKAKNVIVTADMPVKREPKREKTEKGEKGEKGEKAGK